MADVLADLGYYPLDWLLAVWLFAGLGVAAAVVHVAVAAVALVALAVLAVLAGPAELAELAGPAVLAGLAGPAGLAGLAGLAEFAPEHAAGVAAVAVEYARAWKRECFVARQRTGQGSCQGFLRLGNLQA